MLLDPHGRWGPMLENFLFHYYPWKQQKAFLANWPNANAMLAQISNTQCWLGVVKTGHRFSPMAVGRCFVVVVGSLELHKIEVSLILMIPT